MSEEKEKTVLEWVESYNKIKSEDLKAKMIQQVVYRHYVPINEKIILLSSIASQSVRTDEVTGVCYIDMVANEINLVTAIIALYTHLRIDKNENGLNMVAQCYDALTASGLRQLIQDEIGDDFVELLSIHEKELDSAYVRYCSSEAILSRKIKSISSYLSTLIPLDENGKNIFQNPEFIGQLMKDVLMGEEQSFVENTNNEE